ncbi:hypothetical protein [Marinigracilibium pacificum]|uniref:Uncharacterized protein n=1 Tax=Marinigracilibium pacificum TaxID=2729599 RepID=A0A848J7F6_9BACT|nr:hypothetical protein [Marinigracilibium pacificum]NMM50329.1 hypothetical protein [Marinigracilibium pacificum]
MKNIKNIFFFMLLLTGCECDDVIEEPSSGLPPISETGKDFIAFKLNEEIFIADGYYQYSEYNDNGTPFYFMINAEEDFNRREVKQFFNLKFFDEISQGDSILLNQNQGIDFEFNNVYPTPQVIYTHENIVDGYVKFSKVDHETFIISGTFDMTLEKEGFKTLEIKEGRFDFKYK